MVVARASTPQEIDAAFALLSRENLGAVVMGSGPFFNVHRTRIAELAIRYRLPIIFGNRLYVEAGGLMSYGQKLDES
jgi:putative ABC transport system substrate-binding protein